MLTVVIYSVDVSVAVDQLLHHSFHSKPGSQDQWSSAVVHASIQFCCTISDQNLRKHEDTDREMRYNRRYVDMYGIPLNAHVFMIVFMCHSMLGLKMT